jgi:hypothetical protein
MSGATLHITSGIVHNAVKTIVRAKAQVLRQRRRGAVKLDEARACWTALESDDSDLEAQIGTLLCFPRIFGGEYWLYVHGTVLGGRDLWREALQDYVAGIREEFGMLHGEPWPPVDPGSLSFFLQRQAC